MIEKKTHFYNFLKLIPSGKVMTYKSLSYIFGVHPRIIGTLLKQNVNQDLYPCFKVVKSDLSLGGYNLGVNLKEKRLLESGVKVVDGKVDKSYLWDGKVTNCFFGIPLEGLEQVKLKKCIDSILSSCNDAKLLSFQNPFSAHITILFLGNISLINFHSIINKLDSNINNLGLNNLHCSLDRLGNFDSKVYYLCCTKSDEMNSIDNIYNNVLNNLDFEPKRNSFVHHLTLFRARKNISQISTDNTIDNFIDLSCNVCLDKIRFYISYDNIKQIPIADITS